MSGHKRAFDLSKPQNGTALEGGFLDIVSGTPSNSTSGFGKGALAIDTQNGKLYINEGTIKSTTWSEVTGSGGEEFIYAQPGVAESVATTLVSEKANLMVVGDSISNSDSTTFDTFSKGVLEHFKPDAWRGVFFEPPAGIDSPSYGFSRTVGAANNTGAPGDSGYYANFDGVSNSGVFDTVASALDGEFAGSCKLIAYDDARSAGSTIMSWEIAQDALSGNVLSSAEFPNFDRDKLFENSSGVVDFFEPAKLGTSTIGAQFGAVFLTSATTESGFAFHPSLRTQMYANNNTAHQIGQGGGYTNLSTITVSGITEELKTRTVDFDLTSFTLATGNTFNNRYRFAIFQQAAGTSGDDRLVGVVMGFLGYQDSVRLTGLRVNAITRGGAKTANFLLEPGDAGIPDAGGVDFAFSDAALVRRIKVVQANVVMIHLGANDSSVKSAALSNHDPSGYVNQLDSVMTRIQDAATTATTGAVKFIVIGQINPVYNGYTGGYNATSAQEQHDNYSTINSLLIGKSKSRNDMVYFDLESYLNTTQYNTDGFLDGVTAVDDLLDDGVHPNSLGVDVMMSGLWSKISSLAT